MNTIVDVRCVRCGETLDADAVILTGDRRICPSCLCHTCESEPYRFRDENLDDTQMCASCVVSLLEEEAADA